MEKEKNVPFIFFSVSGVVGSVLSFLLAAFSQGFHNFFVNQVGVHPLIIVMALSFASFMAAVFGMGKAREGGRAMTHLSIIVIALILFVITSSIFVVGYLLSPQ